MPPTNRAVGLTDVGLVRSGNEDCYYTNAEDGIHIVCDGMGGHQAGEVASLAACSLVGASFSAFRKGLLNDQRLFTGQDLPPSGELLVRSIRLANRYIRNKSAEDSSLAGMGTTIVAIALEDDNLSIAHVGDSRAYRIDEESLTALTRDHSWVAELQKTSDMSEEEAGSIVGKNVITRALGVRDTVEVDYHLIKTKPGDRFLLCSDGLCGFATDEEMFTECKRGDSSLSEIAKRLVEFANSKGGNDNSTVVLVEITEISETRTEPIEPVNCGEESTDILNAGDDWLQKILPALEKQADAEETESEPEQNSNKTMLIIMFAVFILVAALIMIFSGGNS
ncbi:MAG: Stp1/IreP family PP2C-type Ser/Thr phosphatase [bacterium]|nr:Stp1/IreP family PP2C-type Ser/Thr phosphatase [bacterium]